MAAGGKKTTNMTAIKPVIIVICVLLIILIPISIWQLGMKHKSVSVVQNTVTSYQGSSYILSYPKNWKESQSGVPEGRGEVVYLQPQNADSTVKPHVLLKITDATQINTERMNISYALLKYQKTNEVVGGVSAQKYTAILPGVHGPFHSIAYVFSAKGNLYLLELGYTQKATDPELENEFVQIVSNFKLQN